MIHHNAAFNHEYGEIALELFCNQLRMREISPLKRQFRTLQNTIRRLVMWMKLLTLLVLMKNVAHSFARYLADNVGDRGVGVWPHPVFEQGERVGLGVAAVGL